MGEEGRDCGFQPPGRHSVMHRGRELAEQPPLAVARRSGGDGSSKGCFGHVPMQVL